MMQWPRKWILSTLILVLNINQGQPQIGPPPGFPDTNYTIPYHKATSEIEKSLLSGYQVNVRPVKNSSSQLSVRMGADIISIQEVNEEEQTISFKGSLVYVWQDEFLGWDISKYSGVYQLRLFPGSVWEPDLMLYNSAKGHKMGKITGSYYRDKVVITYAGHMSFSPTFEARVSCSFDYTDYPYDVQECPLVFGSWSYTLKEMDLLTFDNREQKLLGDKEKDYIQNWKIVQILPNVSYWHALAKERNTERPSDTISHLVYPEYNLWIRIKRWVPYFGILIVAPAVMTSLITLASFWLRSYFSCSALLLVNIVLQLVFTDDLIRKLPPSIGTTPRIVRYTALNLCCTVLAAILITILKETSKSFDDQNRPLLSILRFLVYGRNQLMEKINKRFAFSRQYDTEDPQDNVNLGKADKNMSRDHESTNQNAPTWSEAAEVLRFMLFFIYLIVYVVSMLVLLC